MAEQPMVYRDGSGLYVGLVPGFPEVRAVGYTAEEARQNLDAALADIEQECQRAMETHSKPFEPRPTGV